MHYTGVVIATWLELVLKSSELREDVMNYDLKCEGFPLDEELNDRLLLCGREFVLEVGEENPVRMSIRQIDGLVQGRVEIELPQRRLSAFVRRTDPVSAMQAAIEAIRQALRSEFYGNDTDMERVA
jgi:hypothetical protein